MDKIDLVMWSLNGESTLDQCLKAIDEAIPREYVNNKIACDAGSKDGSIKIFQDYDWKVIHQNGGIPFQANKCLQQVTTDRYASFEQDIIPPRNWYDKVSSHLRDNVVVVQGVRVESGSNVFRVLDTWQIRDEPIPWYYSIDNNLYETRIIRAVGGYPLADKFSVDGLLRNELHKRGYKWKVLYNVVSKHLKPGYWNHLRGAVLRSATHERTWEMTDRTPRTGRRWRTMVAPIRAGRMAARYHAPEVFVGYPLLIFTNGLAKVIGTGLHGGRIVRRLEN